MNENTFISRRTHTRVKFEPLITGCQLSCISPDSTAAQTADTSGASPSYVPNRLLTPTVIYPYVRAIDPDNIFRHGPANEYLGTIQWFVNGEPIADVWTVDTDYTIDTSTSDSRGTLSVNKNLPVGSEVVLTFKGEFLDWRTGAVYAVESDEMALTTVNKGEDKIDCSVDKPLITWDALYDDLLLYDYKVARGISVQSTRDSYKNGYSFEQDVNVNLTIGSNSQSTLPTGFTMRVVRLGESTALVPNSAASPELTYATYPTVSFDMRLIGAASYEVQFLKDSDIVARATIGCNQRHTMPVGGGGMRASDISVSQDFYTNSVIINLRDRMVEYPELYYLIQWYTQARFYENSEWKYATAKAWQLGPYLAVSIDKLGIGFTKNDSFFDYWFEVEPHNVYQLATDGLSASHADGPTDGDPLTDNDGNFLLI
jgi:hypothetical protein